jgi:hypothetical protein
LKTNLPVIFSGDLNAISSSPSLTALALAGLSDSWTSLHPGNAGYTCCQTIQDGVTVDVINTQASFLNQRIDYVMTRGDVQPSLGMLVGADSSGRTPSGLWPSDHAGLIVTVDVAQGNNQQ